MLQHIRFKQAFFILGCLCLLNAAKPTQITVTGIDGDVLKNVTQRLTELHKRPPFSAEHIKTLTIDIEKAMYPYGYFNPKITITPHQQDTKASIHIIPGPPMLITACAITLTGEGKKNTTIEQAKRTISIDIGHIFQQKQYEKAKELLANAAEQEGYLRARFTTARVRIDTTKNTATIALTLDTGPLYYVGQVRFNPTTLSPELLHRYLPFQWGDRYSSEQLSTFNSQLSASGYFKNVAIKPTITTDTHVPIDIDLTPVTRTSYSLGAGYGTDTGPRGLAALHIIPVNRSGHTFNAIAQGSLIENAFQAQYLIPGEHPAIDHYSISGGFTNMNYNVGRSNALLLSVTQQHVIHNYQRLLSINGLHERFAYTGENKAEESLVYPKALFSWSKTSDPLFSPSGYHVTVHGLAATRAILSQINLAQIALDAKAAIMIHPLRTRLYFHTIQGITQTSDVDKIPMSLSQVLGGAHNLKGYNFNSIGPGRIISYGGVELQKETFKKWYLIGFFDSGDVYRPRISAFKYDAGFGLMWVSPVGPIKIAIAQPIDHHFGRLSDHSPKLVVNMGPDLS